jgi:hypothetical protein
MTPEDAANIALCVANAGACGALSRLGHRIAWNIASDDSSRAENGKRSLLALGLWSESSDLVAAVARAASKRVKPGSLTERTLSTCLAGADVYILAYQTDALGYIIAYEKDPQGRPSFGDAKETTYAERLSDIVVHLESARETLTNAIARLEGALSEEVASPAVRDAVGVLAKSNAADPPRWDAPEAAQIWRPGKGWTRAVYEGLRQVCVTLGFPVERPAGPISAAEREIEQRILSHPDDDALRREWMVLAAARGETRAELARVQIETRAERRRHPTWRHIHDHPLVRSVVTRHPEWQDEVKRLGARTASFGRGFVETIEIDADVLLRQAEALFRAAPILHVLLRGNAASHLEALLSAGILDRMIAIDLASQNLDDAHTTLLAARGLSALRTLVLDGNRITDAGARALYASESLHHLAYLSLARNPCGPLAAIGQSQDEYPVDIVGLTPLGAKLADELGSRTVLYTLEPPFYDVLTLT